MSSTTALFACSQCFTRHPFEELSPGQQLCKVRVKDSFANVSVNLVFEIFKLLLGFNFRNAGEHFQSLNVHIADQNSNRPGNSRVTLTALLVFPWCFITET